MTRVRAKFLTLLAYIISVFISFFPPPPPRALSHSAPPLPLGPSQKRRIIDPVVPEQQSRPIISYQRPWLPVRRINSSLPLQGSCEVAAWLFHTLLDSLLQMTIISEVRRQLGEWDYSHWHMMIRSDQDGLKLEIDQTILETYKDGLHLQSDRTTGRCNVNAG